MTAPSDLKRERLEAHTTVARWKIMLMKSIIPINVPLGLSH